jgi:hypothetical protein
VNILPSSSLSGSGPVTVQITVNGQQANPATIR